MDQIQDGYGSTSSEDEQQPNVAGVDVAGVDVAGLNIPTALPALKDGNIRTVYLITYSKENGLYTNESFANMVCDAFSREGTAVVMQWACGKERHQDGSCHFHMSVKLDRRKR